MRLYRHRTLVASALLIAALVSLIAPHHRASATVTPPPTCTDPRPGGQTYTATKYLTSPGTLVGTSGRDVLVGTTGADVIKGFGGDDLICGNGGDDLIDAGTGNDVIDAYVYPEPGVAVVYGGAGDDWMDVHGDAHGGTGNDTLSGDLGTFWGDNGNDFLEINSAIAAYGGSGNDTLYILNTPIGDGGSGNDYLIGQYPVTALFGGSGNDTLDGDLDFHVASLDGGSGRDTCSPYNDPYRSCETVN